ncbi:MAG: serine/threonine-protein phosphatase [Bacteroidales bacterium]|nr:serine/threonine-protein phosphatase [Bacteroidales bacterium]
MKSNLRSYAYRMCHNDFLCDSGRFEIVFPILVLLMLGLPCHVIAQGSDEEYVEPSQPQIDSLLNLAKSDFPDSTKARLYYEVSLITNNLNQRLKYGEMSMSLCKETDTAIMIKNSSVMAYCYYVMDRRDILRPFLQRYIDLAIQSNFLFELQKLYKLKARYFDKNNISDSMLYYYNKALEVCIRLQDTSQIAGCYMDIGFNYANKSLYDESEKSYVMALELDSAIGQHLESAVAYYQLGQLYTVRKDGRNYYKAKSCLSKSIEIFDATDTSVIRYVISKYLAYNMLADVYIRLANETNDARYADSCLFYNKQALDFFYKSGYNDYYAYLAFIYVDYLEFNKRYKDALNFLLGLEQYINPHFVDLRNTYYEYLRKVYYELGDYKKAYEYFEKNAKTNSALINDTTLIRIADAKAEQAVMIEKLRHENEEQVHLYEKRRLNYMIISLGIGLVLVILLVFYVLKALKIKQQTNSELSDKNHEIAMQKEIITQQWNEVVTTNKHLTDSIIYAQRIQNAALSPKYEVDDLFPENFIFYRPRDIVSGDYYRVSRCGRYHVLITADCTGHGIPGAFLSMLGISALKEYCVSEENAANPGWILDKMRDFVKSTLIADPKQILNDGMDMTICCYNFDAMEMRYAAANQAAYLVRNGKITKLKGDRMPVGRYVVEKTHFHTVTIPIEHGDMIYTLSDGIQDQLGGDPSNVFGSKFYAKTLEQLLEDVYDKPLDEQYNIIDKTISDWRGNRQQVDDMTLIGIRV